MSQHGDKGQRSSHLDGTGPPSQGPPPPAGGFPSSETSIYPRIGTLGWVLRTLEMADPNRLGGHTQPDPPLFIYQLTIAEKCEYH